ncbi:MAG: cyclic pyranopterin monophosphate synthase MoaC [Candidatus Omnitrophica bacterium]|nr:cyclic pyranopterin monophosphate synthase MoaC [Candidatus Omnitrophota bacterium]
MIDISSKKPTKRKAVAEGRIFIPADIIKKIKEKKIPKGDVLKTAEIAGLFAFKNTVFTIPHCHPVKITKGEISFTVGKESITVKSVVEGIDRTGFEMEALNGVATALLTIYDMCKVYGYKMEISEIRLIKKTGGKSAI